jgi:hypothetical protein
MYIGQVLAQIQIGCSFTRDATTGKYWIKLRAEHSKNNKPVMLPIPDKLTDYFSHYITVARATLLRLAGANITGNDRNYVFLKQSGAGPRPEFSEWTRYVTKTIIGRPVTAHAFRSSIITTYYENGANTAQMTDLARFMSHDPTTARQYYYKPQYTEKVLEANKQIESILMSPANSTESTNTNNNNSDSVDENNPQNADNEIDEPLHVIQKPNTLEAIVDINNDSNNIVLE